MIIYNSRRRQVFLHTPLDHIPTIARRQSRGRTPPSRLRRTGFALRVLVA